MVVPVDPFEGGEFDRFEAPRSKGWLVHTARTSAFCPCTKV